MARKSEFQKSVGVLQDQQNEIVAGIRVGVLLEPSAIAAAISDLCSDIQQLGEEQREKKSNMPDSLQESDTGQLLEERADLCDETAEALEQAAQDIESLPTPSEDDEPAWAADVADILAEVNWSL